MAAKTYTYKRMFAYALTIAVYTGNGIYMLDPSRVNDEVLKDLYVRRFIHMQYRYFTCWNFFNMMLHAAVGLVCELLILTNSKTPGYKLPKHLKGFRDTLFAAILFPSTLVVSTVFWSLFNYDRDLILPAFVDKVLTPASNHIIHTLIIPFVVWEVYYQPRTPPKSHARYLGWFAVYVSMYLSVLFYTYYKSNVWLYPIFGKLYATAYFPLLLIALILLGIVSYYTQWVLTSIFWKVQVKSGRSETAEKTYTYKRMFAYALTIAVHIGNGIYMLDPSRVNDEVLNDLYFRRFIHMRYRYFTCWNFFNMMLHAAVGLVCELLILNNSKTPGYKLPKHLKGFKDTLFAAILFPSTLVVTTVFWSLFNYDRDLILPAFVDKVLTPASNHIIHTLIIPFVVWEVYYQPRTPPKSHARYLGWFAVYVSMYLSVLFYTYYKSNVWLYPIFGKLYATAYFPLLLIALILLGIVSYYTQWVLTSIFWKVQVKSGRRKVK